MGQRREFCETGDFGKYVGMEVERECEAQPSCHTGLPGKFILWAWSSQPGSESLGGIKQLGGCGR